MLYAKLIVVMTLLIVAVSSHLTNGPHVTHVHHYRIPGPQERSNQPKLLKDDSSGETENDVDGIHEIEINRALNEMKSGKGILGKVFMN